jgi:hypothetical protein
MKFISTVFIIATFSHSAFADLPERYITESHCRYSSNYHGEIAPREIFAIYTQDIKKGELKRLRRREILTEGYVPCHVLKSPLRETCELDITNSQSRSMLDTHMDWYEEGFHPIWGLKRNLEVQETERDCIKWFKPGL